MPSRVPNLLLPYIRDMIHGGGTLAVPVVLYGNRNYDDGLMELRNVLRDNGFCPVAAGALWASIPSPVFWALAVRTGRIWPWWAELGGERLTR